MEPAQTAIRAHDLSILAGAHPLLGGSEVEHAQRGRVAVRLVVAQGAWPRRAVLLAAACKRCRGHHVLGTAAPLLHQSGLWQCQGPG